MKACRSGGSPIPVERMDGAADPWTMQLHLSGRTPVCASLTCHSSLLDPGHQPHAPHTHEDEELLVMVRGSAELELPEHPEPDRRRTVLKAGEFVYYPAHFPHTLRARGDRPAAYTMFRWRARVPREGDALAHRKESIEGPAGGSGAVDHSLVFEQPTRQLGKLQCHRTVLAPAAGYPPHPDPYDVGILLWRGSVETLGRRFDAPSVIFYRAGEPHGMLNHGEVEAQYMVFEFHPLAISCWRRAAIRARTLAEKARDPARWKRKLRQLAGRGE